MPHTGETLDRARRLESVHALTGVMADHNATTGVLVTTSWFGRASEEFAQRNRITQINGSELKHLIKENWGSTSFQEQVHHVASTRPTTHKPDA